MSEQALASLSAGAASEQAAVSVLAIGLMSGTSQDGVDVALIDTDGERDCPVRRYGLPALHQGRAYAAAPRYRRGGQHDRPKLAPRILSPKPRRW